MKLSTDALLDKDDQKKKDRQYNDQRKKDKQWYIKQRTEN
jgi:hypothetical protein